MAMLMAIAVPAKPTVKMSCPIHQAHQAQVALCTMLPRELRQMAPRTTTEPA
jgi:hypothetical protein